MNECKNCGKALRKYSIGYDKHGKAIRLLLHVNNSGKCKKPESRWKNGKNMTVRDIYSKKDRANYIKNFPKESRPDLSKKVKSYSISSLLSDSDKKAVK